MPAFEAVSLDLRLDIRLGSLFVICTVILAATSYIVNDILDQEADHINKPNRSYIPNRISTKVGWIYYGALLVIGFLIAVYIAMQIEALPLLIIYPIASILLYLYSRSWKLQGSLGNLVVAGFTAFVPGVLLIAEPALLDVPALENARDMVIYFVVLSFLVNLARELVKDIEDIEGDKSMGSKSLPITMGIDRTKVLAAFVIVLALVTTGSFAYMVKETLTFRSGSFLGLFVLSLLGLSLLRLGKAEVKADFSRVSALLKLIMLAGLIFLIIQHS